MATTAVLRPHDCLRDHSGQRSNRSSRCRCRKRSPSDGIRHRSNHSSSPPSKALVMGQVRILKRGEDLKPRMFRSSSGDVVDLDLSSTDRLGPDPEIVRRHVRFPDLYAGVSAPPPSSLPFPAALVRRSVVESDLRKLLRI